MRLLVLSSCVSMGDGSVRVKVLSSVCCCEIVIGRGIVGVVVKRGSLVGVFCDGCWLGFGCVCKCVSEVFVGDNWRGFNLWVLVVGCCVGVGSGRRA
jgi:hypothetical protein